MTPAQRAAIERARARKGAVSRKMADTLNAPLDKCGWFVLCASPPTTTRDHPLLGPVAICARCDEKVSNIDRATKDRP